MSLERPIRTRAAHRMHRLWASVLRRHLHVDGVAITLQIPIAGRTASIYESAHGRPLRRLDSYTATPTLAGHATSLPRVRTEQQSNERGSGQRMAVRCSAERRSQAGSQIERWSRARRAATAHLSRCARVRARGQLRACALLAFSRALSEQQIKLNVEKFGTGLFFAGFFCHIIPPTCERHQNSSPTIWNQPRAISYRLHRWQLLDS